MRVVVGAFLGLQTFLLDTVQAITKGTRFPLQLAMRLEH